MTSVTIQLPRTLHAWTLQAVRGLVGQTTLLRMGQTAAPCRITDARRIDLYTVEITLEIMENEPPAPVDPRPECMCRVICAGPFSDSRCWAQAGGRLASLHGDPPAPKPPADTSWLSSSPEGS